jgi:predicted amidohydrolase
MLGSAYGVGRTRRRVVSNAGACARTRTRPLCNQERGAFRPRRPGGSLAKQGDNPSPDLMKLMRRGDVFTHCFHGFQNGILDGRGKILPGVRDARERGIFFDVGADRNAISFDVAEQALQQGFLPDTISSDLTVAAATHSTGDLPNVVPKMMALGMNLEQVTHPHDRQQPRVE